MSARALVATDSEPFADSRWEPKKTGEVCPIAVNFAPERPGGIDYLMVMGVLKLGVRTGREFAIPCRLR